MITNKNKHHMNAKILSFEKLIKAIEDLDEKGIISFENFKALHFSKINSKFFSLVAPEKVDIAILTIDYKRNEKQRTSL